MHRRVGLGHRCLRVAAVVPLLLVLAGGAPALEGGYQTVDDETLEKLHELHYKATEHVRLVLLPTAVTDKRGRVVRGLEKKDFQVFEDSVPQEIRFFSAEAREPVSIAFLLDVSGSMRQLQKLRHAKEAIRFFVDQLRPDDQFGLICFADEQVAWVTDFTHDRETFLQRLFVQEGYGQTALHDAVAAAPGLVDDSIRGRKAIVLITDGVDNSSRLGRDMALSVARRVNVPIYSIGFMSVAQEALPKGVVETNLEELTMISEETGGRMFPVHDPVDLKEAVTTVSDELRFQYMIGYYPSRAFERQEFRVVRLEAKNRRWQVRTRSGYFANP